MTTPISNRFRTSLERLEARVAFRVDAAFGGTDFNIDDQLDLPTYAAIPSVASPLVARPAVISPAPLHPSAPVSAGVFLAAVKSVTRSQTVTAPVVARSSTGSTPGRSALAALPAKVAPAVIHVIPAVIYTLPAPAIRR